MKIGKILRLFPSQHLPVGLCQGAHPTAGACWRCLTDKARSCRLSCVWDEAMPAQPRLVPSCSCQAGAEDRKDDTSCIQRGSGDVMGNLGEVICNILGQYSTWGRLTTTLQRTTCLANQPGHPAWGAERCPDHEAVAIPKSFCLSTFPKAPECLKGQERHSPCREKTTG